MKLEELNESTKEVVDIHSMQTTLKKLAKEAGFLDIKPDTEYFHGNKDGNKRMVAIKADLPEYARRGFMKKKEFQQLKKKVKSTFGEDVGILGYAHEVPDGPYLVLFVPEK